MKVQAYRNPREFAQDMIEKVNQLGGNCRAEMNMKRSIRGRGNTKEDSKPFQIQFIIRVRESQIEQIITWMISPTEEADKNRRKSCQATINNAETTRFYLPADEKHQTLIAQEWGKVIKQIQDREKINHQGQKIDILYIVVFTLK